MGTSIYNHAHRATSCPNVLGILLCTSVRRMGRRAARVAARGVGSSLPSVLLTLLLPAVVLAAHPFHAGTQSTASIEGQVTDQNGAVVRGAEVAAVSRELGLRRTAVTDDAGRFQVAALAVGDYRIEVRASGFKTEVVESATVEVGKSLALNFRLQVGDVSEQVVTVTAEQDLTEQTTMAVGHVVAQRMVHETPLNGRYFLDLGLRMPGSVTPPQGAFSASPMRGLGSLAFNTAGNREETVNYLVNGITLNNLTFSSVSFQLPLSTIREFKVDNSTFGAQYGESSGAVVNIATRSGTNAFHGELFEFLRNDALDARNFFEFNSARS